MTSQEKIRQLAAQLLEQRISGALATSLTLLVPQLLKQLPEDPEVLDRALYEYAAVCLSCRSDDARALAIVWADEHGLLLKAPDAEAEAVEEPAELGAPS